jgi:hypothetical protein
MESKNKQREEKLVAKRTAPVEDGDGEEGGVKRTKTE